MNKRIEKFLLWACLAQGFAWLAARCIPGITSFLVFQDMDAGDSSGLSGVNIVTIVSLLSMLSYLPLQFVCGVWLRKESERIGGNRWIWFFTGFFFRFIGVIVFYVYLNYCEEPRKTRR